MSNYWIYTVTVTNLENGSYESQAYFSRKIATSAFRELCDEHGYDYRNVIVRRGDKLVIAKSISKDYEITICEEQILTVLDL
jgi:hypothetical protein